MRSPRALVMASCPPTLPFKISPPSFFTLSCSEGLLVLWSTVTLLAVPSRLRTALVSPKLATCTTLCPPLVLTKAIQQVVPVSLAPTSFNWSSALAKVLSKTPLISVLFFSYSCSKSWITFKITLGRVLAQNSETSAPPWPSRMAKSPQAGSQKSSMAI